MSLPHNHTFSGTNNINIASPQPTRSSIDARRQSMAKLSSPLARTPNSSHLTTIYRDRHSSSSTNGTENNNSHNNSNNNLNNNSNNNSNSNLITNSLNINSTTPNSRKFLFSVNNSNSTNILRASSPAIESDDDSNSITQSYGSFVDDPTILKNVTKHLPTDPQNALKLPSGDITRDLYQLSTPVKLRRSKSMSGNEIERRGSVASQMRLPGGFRRDFIQMKKKKFGYTLTQPTILTKNFLEFLTIYGHFAGEDLEDEDFVACDYDTSSPDKTDEESPLLQNINNNHNQNQIKSESEGHKSSSIKAFFLLLKAFVGTGILFLPKAFSNGGLTFCIVLLTIFSVLSYYCYLFLSQATSITGISSFAELGNKTYGKTLRMLILVSIVAAQIGFVAAYTVFTAENLRAFLKNTINLEYPLYYFVIFETICFAPMSLIRNITKLSLAALLANVFILSGIATIVFYTSKDLINNGPSEIKLFNKDKWSLFIGVAIFAFEGIGLIIPVQQSMKHPEDFPKVLLAVICVCCVLFIGIGSLCYITYGEKVQTVVILNLPQDSIPVISIQFFYALAIMLSVPLQILPAIRIIESRIFKRRLSGKVDPKTKLYKNALRIFITVSTSIIAYLGSSNLDVFVSFIGCVACIPLVYMYPPMLHLKVVANSKIQKGIDIFLTILGGVALIYTTSQFFI